MTFETRVMLAGKRNGYSVHWEPCKYGYRRAVVDCVSYDEFNAVQELMRRLKNVRVETHCIFQGSFTGTVYIYDADDYNDLVLLNQREMERVNNWWMRYHNADEETRRLMACGAVE